MSSRRATKHPWLRAFSLVSILAACQPATSVTRSGAGQTAAPRVSAPNACGDDEVSCRAAATAACGGDGCAHDRLGSWCDRSDAVACYTLGWENDHSRPEPFAPREPSMGRDTYAQRPHDSVAARRFYQRSCELGFTGGCVNLAALLEWGHGGDVDWARAERLLEAACHAGSARGCTGWAAVYFNGPPEKRDEARAAALTAVPCNDGDAVACSNLAYQYLTGRGVVQDAARGIELQMRACRAGEGVACVNVATIHAQGLYGVPRDETRATALMLAACDASSPSWFGCGAAGRRVAEGLGTPADRVRGVAILERSCDHDYAIGCAELGYYYEVGKVAAVDPVKAASFYARACQLGHAPSCAKR